MTMRMQQSKEFSDDEDDDLEELSEEEEDETVALKNPDRAAQEDLKGWDVFRVLPPEQDYGSGSNLETITSIMKIMRAISYILTFIIVLGAAGIAKSTLLFMTSQLKFGRSYMWCNDQDRSLEAVLPIQETVAWTWCVFFVFCAPEVFAFGRALRIVVFKTVMTPTFGEVLLFVLFETLHTLGVAMFVFMVLPELDVFKGAMLTNAACLLPAFFCMLARSKSEKHRGWRYLFDVLAVAGQILALILWPVEKGLFPSGVVAESHSLIWTLPTSLVLVSFGWWENYVDENSPVGFISWLGKFSEGLKRKRYFIHLFSTIWKAFVFFLSMLVIWTYYIAAPAGLTSLDTTNKLFEHFLDGFGKHDIPIRGTQNGSQSSIIGGLPADQSIDLAPMWVLVIQIIAAVVCYVFGKFACRVNIQGFSFALPLNLTVPAVLTFLIVFCGLHESDTCAFKDAVPRYLFFECPRGEFVDNVLFNQFAFLWFIWFLAQVWITIHIWTPKCERLAATEKLFLNPYYSGIFLDQSMSMNRKRDSDVMVKVEDVKLDGSADVSRYADYYQDDDSSVMSEGSGHRRNKVVGTDTITRIYACATLWHETKDEMKEYLKSVFRMDEDQAARRIAQKYLSIVDPDYYEYETHIFFDDAFEIADDDENEHVVNPYVKLFVNTIDEAASHVHQCFMRVRAPQKIPTPYGGRLVYTLPGKTKIVVHMKDKDKIRHKKRWSQCMYMYYLLGHKLMDEPISIDRKAVIAENTYILALDGDVDFQPEAVRLLVDLMKKNKKLGAACGRIHPVGGGPMVWYQKFEYAIGHWFQKATEHVIGCVLCSPGCFSLFRAKALMDDNVMKMYTTMSEEARHYVQYDQGEDRWLCTLILQRGYRVEYCAASDSWTHAPEGFNEFYNQRRRWVPSTMANIFDLLSDAKRAVKVNESLSYPYIGYQAFLMLGTILGPGTIFLMIVGAFNSAFGMDIMTSFALNLVPLVFYMTICYFAKADMQLTFAQILSTIYALVMMAVLVGMIKQMLTDGMSSPSAIFFIASALSFILAACMHPQEFWCLPCGLVYYLTVPSMYLLLIIYSLFNLNNVSWGTREVAKKKTRDEMEADRIAIENAKKEAKDKSMLSWLNANKSDEEEGSIEFNLANLIKIMCCTHKKPDQKHELLRIADTLEELKKKLDRIENAGNPTSGMSLRRRSTGRLSMARTLGQPLNSLIEEAEEEEDDLYVTNEMDDEGSSESSIVVKPERDDLKNPYWLEDRDLKRGVVEFLPGTEITFFRDLIERYLYPLNKNAEKQKKTEADLRELRDSMVFFFFIINSLYVVCIFFFQLNKDLIYVEWPWGAFHEVSFSVSGSVPTVNIETKKLQLEPIGLIFVVFYFAVMVIQFIAMFIHRVSTFSHMISSVNLDICSRRVEDVSEDAFLEKNGVKMVRDMAVIKGADRDFGDPDEGIVGPERRMTIHNLQEGARFAKRRQTVTLEAAFRKRFMSISAQGNTDDPVLRRLSMRGDTLRALETKRDSVVAVEQRRMSVKRLSMSASSDSRRMSFGNGSLDSMGFSNRGYQDDDKED